MGGLNGVISVLIADDQPSFVDALEAFLSYEERVKVVGRAENGEEAARLAADLRPQVVLMDVSMPVLDGFAATRMIREALPETRVVFLTGSADPHDVEQAVAAGASAYVTKDRMADELVETILSAAPPCDELS